MDSNSIILVFKIGSRDKTDEELSKILNKLREQVQEEVTTGNVSFFFLPNSKSEDVTIECINPKLVTAEVFKEAELKLQHLQNYIDKYLNNVTS